MKLSRAAVRLAMGGLAVGAGLVVTRLLGRGRDRGTAAAPEPPAPDQLIGTPRARLSAVEAAQTFESDSDRLH